MALEVNEIHISMRARDREAGGEHRPVVGERAWNERERAEIVADCVRRVLDVLASFEER